MSNKNKLMSVGAVPHGLPLVDPHTREQKVGSGRATFKTASAAAHAAQQARDEVRSEAKLARQLNEQACDFARAARQEVQAVTGRAVLVCSLLAAAAVLPWLVWLGTLLW